MRSGIAFDENYLDPDADVRVYERVIGWAPHDGAAPTSLYDYIAGLRAAREHGGGFQYRSIETDMLGWVCERASGTRMPTLLSDVLWARLGTEQDLDATVDRSGAVLHDGGFSVTLRDLARFGLMIADNGRVGGEQIVPADWFDDAAAGSDELRVAFAAMGEDEWMPGGWYRSQLWVPFPDRDVLMCLGIHGQMVYADRSRRFVAVKLSSTPDPTPEREYFDTVALIEQLAEHCTA
jgi:CubicO group peptidase (beta-lactamase class C family)